MMSDEVTRATAALEELERKCGRRFTPEDWRVLRQKADEDLTADDFTVIGFYEGAESVGKARARQIVALGKQTTPTPPAPPAPLTKSQSPAVQDRESSEPDTLDGFLKKHGKRSATLNDLNEIFELLMETWWKKFTEMNSKNIERNRRLDAIEERLGKVEARPLQKWAGVHVAGMTYAEASLVTRQGSLWVATKQTKATPGDENADWRLVVKKGHA